MCIICDTWYLFYLIYPNIRQMIEESVLTCLSYTGHAHA